jgi:hypothetical protein
MKKPLLFCLFAIVLVAVAMWLLRQRSLSAPSPGLKPAVVTDASPTPILPSSVPVSPTAKQLPGGAPEPADPRWKGREIKRQVDPNSEWKMPINFYGRVVDENDLPIPGAKVEFSWTDLSAEGSSQSSTLSDSTGAFSLEGKTGRVLQVDVSKDGYYKPKNERLKSFDYAGFWEANYHEPDRAKPVLFRLLKKGQGEPLSAGEKQPTIPPDGTPVRLDLLNGARASPQGQVEIAAVTNTEKYPPRMFDWQAAIAIPDGGLLEHNMEFPFEAPEEGYVPKVEIKMSASAPDWRRSLEKSYFIRFGTPPKYGRMRVRINGASPKVFLDYAVNPSGSRNLELREAEQLSSP